MKTWTQHEMEPMEVSTAVILAMLSGWGLMALGIVTMLP